MFRLEMGDAIITPPSFKIPLLYGGPRGRRYGTRLSPSWGHPGLLCSRYALMHGQQRGYRLLLRGGYTGGIDIIFRSLLSPFEGLPPRRDVSPSRPRGLGEDRNMR